jgi:hypothetical protein
MDIAQFWKNFKLGEELDIAGRFIYNGLRYFHEMDTLYYEEEIFEVLYNLSVGLERLLKIAVVLIEHDAAPDQEAFERSLITHSHSDLMRRVQEKHKLPLAGPHNQLLGLLDVFYRTQRYGRYSLTAINATGQEKAALHAYLIKYLRIELDEEFPFQIPQNSPRIRKFIGSIVGKIVSAVFPVIQDEAHRINIYTHEIRSDSKAAKIFLSKEFDFTNEDVLWRELLIYLVNSKEMSGHLGYIKRLQPLDFDPASDFELLQCFASDEKKLRTMDELDALYEEIDKPGERLKAVNLIADPMVDFDDRQ